jgi:hypothetical protein
MRTYKKEWSSVRRYVIAVSNFYDFITDYIVDQDFLIFIKNEVVVQTDKNIYIRTVEYTESLQEAKVYTEKYYKEEIKAWERFFDVEEGNKFRFLPVETRFNIKELV